MFEVHAQVFKLATERAWLLSSILLLYDIHVGQIRKFKFSPLLFSPLCHNH